MSVLDTMNEYCRVLSSDGIASHRIDLKDHLGGSLNNLCFSVRVWESDFSFNQGCIQIVSVPMRWLVCWMRND